MSKKEIEEEVKPDHSTALSASAAWIANLALPLVHIHSTDATKHSSVTTIRLPPPLLTSTVQRRQLLWLGNEDVHLGLITTYVPGITFLTVMDRTRGVVLYTLSCDNTPSLSWSASSLHNTLSARCIGVLVTAPPHFHIVSLSNEDRKVALLECQVATGQVLRKVKLGRWKGGDVGAVDYGELWSRCCSLTPTKNGGAIALAVLGGEPSRLKAIQLSDGRKLYQRKLDSPVSLLVSPSISIMIHRDPSSATSAGELFHTTTGQRIAPLPDGEGGWTIPSDLFTADYQMAVTNECVWILHPGARHLLQIQLRSATSDSVQYDSYTVERRYRIHYSEDDQPRRLFLHAHSTENSVHLVALQLPSLRVIRIPVVPNMTTSSEEETSVINISFSNDAKSTSSMGPTPVEPEPVNNTPSSSRKRKDPPTVLGPGQAGGEAPLKEDPSTREDDENEPTVGERLRLLRQALEEEESDDEKEEKEKPSSFIVRHATTESLTQLVSQALQSSDGAMLEQALQVRDKDVLRTTCQTLTVDQVTELLDAILLRLAQKPNRAEPLVAWVTAILQSNQITQMQHLQPLQNLLTERLEVFPMLIQLEGRLENMIGM